MTGSWSRTVAESGAATGGWSSLGLGRMSTRIRPAATAEPTCAAYVTRKVPWALPVTVRTLVSRLVSMTSAPGPRTSEARRIRAPGSVGSAPGTSLPSGWTWTGLPTTARTTSGWVCGGSARASSVRTVTLAWPSADAPWPSPTEYFTGKVPGLSGAVTPRAPDGSTLTAGSGESTDSGSFSPSRQSATTPTVTWPLRTTGYLACASLAWPPRTNGGELTESSTTWTTTLPVAREFWPLEPLFTV